MHVINISTDGSLTVYDSKNIKITAMSGDISILSHVLGIIKISADEKRRLPERCRIRAKQYSINIIQDNTLEVINIPIEHALELCKYITIKGTFLDFIAKLESLTITN